MSPMDAIPEPQLPPITARSLVPDPVNAPPIQPPPPLPAIPTFCWLFGAPDPKKLFAAGQKILLLVCMCPFTYESPVTLKSPVTVIDEL